jgi:uncharacterized membrane protein
MRRIGVVAILILAFCGLANAVYITQHEISGTPLLCDIQNLTGCNIVANSPYAHLFGIPVAAYGIFFYSVLFILTALELVFFNTFLRRLLQEVALLGVIASLYFTVIQVFFIRAFCIYCIASASITLIVFILTFFIEPFRKEGSVTDTRVSSTI